MAAVVRLNQTFLRQDRPSLALASSNGSTIHTSIPNGSSPSAHLLTSGSSAAPAGFAGEVHDTTPPESSASPTVNALSIFRDDMCCL